MSIFDKDGRSDPLTCANKQIEVLQEKLAKANERVKELTKENLSIVNGVNKYSFEYAKVDFSVELNKFAIEKKIEALDEVESVYMQAAETSEPMSFREAFDLVEEQLRKEQE